MARMKQISIDVDVHRSIEQNRRSFSESENDILRRLLDTPPVSRKVNSEGHTPTPSIELSRSRGNWTVEVKGQRTSAANLKDAYRTLLHQLSDIAPGFLDIFAKEKARSRRFVAKSASELYISSPHLAQQHARLLKDGWYFDTNLSSEQVSQRARIAARLCGMHYGTDVRVLDNLREI